MTVFVESSSTRVKRSKRWRAPQAGRESDLEMRLKVEYV